MFYEIYKKRNQSLGIQRPELRPEEQSNMAERQFICEHSNAQILRQGKIYIQSAGHRLQIRGNE
jgi:hypothetical protein